MVYGSVEDLLSYKGRNELKRQLDAFNRAESRIPGTGVPFVGPRPKQGTFSSLINSAFHVTKTGETELGGRLRDEIFRTSIRDTGKTISGWVVSPTPYAKYQEYGTSHNRPQPYMRPALYRMRQRLPRIVAQSLGRRVV